MAAHRGNKKVAEMLLCAGAAVNEPDGNKATPLRVATRRINSEVVRLLLEWHAGPNRMGPDRAKEGLSTTSKQLRDVFDEAVLMPEQKLESLKAT